MENYFAAKAKLFSMCEKAVINIDDLWGKRLAEQTDCPVITYSSSRDNADITAKNIKLTQRGVSYCALSVGSLWRVQVPVPGMFTVYNSLAAIGAGTALKIDRNSMAEALRATKGVKGRAEVVETGREYEVVIDYAHTPDAMENIITSLRPLVPGRLITVFGCGGNRDKGKRPEMGLIAGELSDHTIVTSDNPRDEAPMEIIRDILPGVEQSGGDFSVIADRREAIRAAMSMAVAGDLVLLAGKGHETYQIIKGRSYHFDEREIVRDYGAGA
jgi:UDP-N-acetylmuramoyl-L-alanyl-D-glutamate--2,6-diaminopimelate ligase